MQRSFLVKADDRQFIQGLQLFERFAHSYCGRFLHFAEFNPVEQNRILRQENCRSNTVSTCWMIQALKVCYIQFYMWGVFIHRSIDIVVKLFSSSGTLWFLSSLYKVFIIVPKVLSVQRLAGSIFFFNVKEDCFYSKYAELSSDGMKKKRKESLESGFCYGKLYDRHCLVLS